MHILSLLVGLILTGCGNYSNTNAPSPKSFDTLSFEAVKGMVFEQNCYGCHSDAKGNHGNINLERLDGPRGVRALMPSILVDLSNDYMPKNSPPLPDSLKQIVIAWANIGSPMTSIVSMPGKEGVKGGPPPIPVGFDQVRDKVLVPYCVRCHSFLTDPETVKKAGDKIINAISFDMPKHSKPLSDTAKKLVINWVNGGMLTGSEEVRQKVLTPYCVRCHSSFTNGDVVSKKALNIWAMVMSDEMPRNDDPVPDDLKKILDDWYKTGAAN